MVIELTDEETGVVERIEEENMVTNVVNHILGLNPMGIFIMWRGSMTRTCNGTARCCRYART